MKHPRCVQRCLKQIKGLPGAVATSNGNQFSVLFSFAAGQKWSSLILSLQSRENIPADLEVKLEAEGAVVEEVMLLTLTSLTSSQCALMRLNQSLTQPAQHHVLRPVTGESPPRSPLLREEPLLLANWLRDPSDSQLPWKHKTQGASCNLNM